MKTKKPKMKSLLKLWGQQVHEEWKFKCPVCTSLKMVSPDKLDAHHIIDKRYAPTRYSVLNGILLCPLHHRFSPIRSAHGNPIWFINWLTQEFPSRLSALEDIIERNI